MTQKRSLKETSVYRKVIREFKQLNPEMTLNNLAELFEVSPKTVESWVYEDKGSPHFGHMILLHRGAITSKCKLPRELTRIAAVVENRAGAVRKTLGSGKYELIGEKKQEKVRVYLYKGDLLSMSEIAAREGVAVTTIRRKVNGLTSGSDVSDLVKAKPRGRKKNLKR